MCVKYDENYTVCENSDHNYYLEKIGEEFYENFVVFDEEDD